MRYSATELRFQLPGFAGTNNVQDASRLNGPVVGNPSVAPESAMISNFDITDTGSAVTRDGSTKVYTGTPHSLDPNGSGYFVESTFKLLLPNYSAVSLCSLLAPTLPMSYAKCNYLTVCSNGVDIFIVENNIVSAFAVPTVEFKVSILPAQHIAFFGRRLYYAVGHVLYYSDADNIEQSDTRDPPFVFNAPITMVMPLDNGIVVGADKVYWIAGQIPEEMAKPNDTYDGTAVAGTDVVFDAKLFGGSGKIGMFTANDGICLCTDSGQIQNLTLSKIGFTAQQHGTAIIRKKNGCNQYLTWV
jgi:hypothetical protein